MRPLIGLPGRRKYIEQVVGMPATLGHLPLDVYFAEYAQSVWAAGGMPVHLPMDADPVDWVHHLDGIVLTGGADIEPGRYGHVNTASDTEPRRDEVEFALLDAAITDGLPVLGICRGFQLVNVHAGGTLVQDRPEHMRLDVAPSAEVHGVTFVSGTRMHDMYGSSTRVNSLHHQIVDTVGSGLTASAHADDGTIEGIEVDGERVIAVQWHPEMMRRDDPSFFWLVDQARRA